MKLQRVLTSVAAALIACTSFATWSFTYQYEGTSTISSQYGSQTGSLNNGPSSSPQPVAAGYPGYTGASFEAEITVVASWNGPGTPPDKPVFKASSTTISFGQRYLGGQVNNGLGDAAVLSNGGSQLTAAGDSYIIGTLRPDNSVVLRFNVSGTSQAISPSPFLLPMAVCSNQLTVAPDTHAAAVFYEVDPTSYAKTTTTGQAVGAMHENKNTESREATSCLKYYGSWPFGYWGLVRTVSFQTPGFPPSPSSTFSFGSSSASFMFSDFTGAQITEGISDADFESLVANNQPKVVQTTLTANDLLAGLSRTGTLKINFYPPQTIVKEGTFALKAHWGPQSEWPTVSNVYTLVPGASVSISTSLTESNSISIGVVNGVKNSAELGLLEALKIGLEKSYTLNVGQTAVVARNWTQTIGYQNNTAESVTIRIVASPYYFERKSTCHEYVPAGFNGVFEAFSTKWASPSKELAESNDMWFATRLSEDQ